MSEKSYQYTRIASSLSDMIRNGVLVAGQRMPSLRQLSAQHNVSMGTAVQVYRQLEDDGLIVSRERSGYFVRDTHMEPRDLQPQITALPDTPQLASHAQLNFGLLRAARMPGVLSLGIVATPVGEYLPQSSLARALSSVCRKEISSPVSYGDFQGYLPLRIQIARRMIDAGCHIAPDEILITNGCQESMFLAFSVITKPGDTVMLESPTYFGAIHILETLGVKALEIPTDPTNGIDLDAVERAIKKHRITAAMCMPVCQNPLGASMPEKNKQRLVEIFEKENIPLIENDAMGELIYKRPRPCAAKSFDRTGNVIFCSSFSKTLGPGHRVGWIIPGKFAQSINYLKAVNNGGSAIWMQMAIAEMLSRSGYIQALNKSLNNYKERVTTIRNWVKQYFPQGTRVSKPQGGYLLWVEFPESVKTIELFERLLEKKIAIASGEVFSPNAVYKHHIRLNCGEEASDLDRVHEAIKTIGALAKEMC